MVTTAFLKSNLDILKKQSSQTIRWVKWAALLFMVVDHVGVLFFDNNVIMRSVGRMAFLLFGYLLVHNYLFFSRNKKRYIRQILIFALISQPPYMLIIGTSLNILFLLGFSLLVIYLIEEYVAHINGDIGDDTVMVSVILAGLIASHYTSYGALGYVFLISLYLGFKHPVLKFFPLILLGLVNDMNTPYLVGAYSSILVIILLSVWLRNRKDYKRRSGFGKWFFYAFYPIHLIVLTVIFYYLNPEIWAIIKLSIFGD